MTFATVNDKPLISAEITEPRIGVWHAILEVDDENEPEGAGVVIGLSSGNTYVGTAISSGQEHGRNQMLVVGGAGGLRNTLPPRFYAEATLKNMLDDVMRECGETLDDTADVAFLEVQPPRFHRSRGRGTDAIQQMTEHVGMTAGWRLLRNGNVYVVAAESWPELELQHLEISRDRNTRTLEIAPHDDDPDVIPGVTFAGLRIASVKTVVNGSSVRQFLKWSDEDGRGDGSLGDNLRKIGAAKLDKSLDYLRSYPATVISQSGTMLEVNPDDERIRGTGVSKVELRHGIPGATVVVTQGSRVNLFFENGDPTKPAASLWPDGSSVQSLTFAQSAASAKFVSLSDLVNARFDALESKLDSHITLYNAHVHPGVSSGGGSTGPTVSTDTAVTPGSSTAATIVKAQ